MAVTLAQECRELERRVAPPCARLLIDDDARLVEKHWPWLMELLPGTWQIAHDLVFLSAASALGDATRDAPSSSVSRHRGPY